MRRKVVAIGLDAADPVLVERWIAEGHLPNLARLRERGAYGRLSNTVELNGVRTETFNTEVMWVDFASGCKPGKTRFWDTIEYSPERYGIRNVEDGSPAFDRLDPFYALAGQRRTIVFDLPAAKLSPRVDGAQILGWGGHFPHTESHSQPPELLAEIVARHGENPILNKDGGIWWDKAYCKWLREALERSVEARTAVCKDLMEGGDWDLFLAVFAEAHSAGHDVYLHSQPDHPLHPYVDDDARSLLLDTYRNVDRAIGEIEKTAPPDACIVCFSLHGMGPNYTDMLSSAMLPEILYRHNFPGSMVLGPGRIDEPPPPMVTKPVRGAWMGELWARQSAASPFARLVRPWLPRQLLKAPLNGVASPYSDENWCVPMGWNPTVWYRPLWPKMRAFALPAFTMGQIRINLRGRERDGIVEPADYDRVCAEIEDLLYRLRDGRSGEPLVKKVYRSRAHAGEDGPHLPNYDLSVLWHERITDVVDSPDVGRVGPLTHYRAGGHWNRGFVLAAGPGIAARSTLRSGDAVDIAPTILELLDCPIPEHYDGRSLLGDDPKVLAPVFDARASVAPQTHAPNARSAAA